MKKRWTVTWETEVDAQTEEEAVNQSRHLINFNLVDPTEVVEEDHD